MCLKLTQGRRERGGGRGRQPSPPYPHHFLEEKTFSLVKLENMKLWHVNDMRGLSLLVEQDISDKK